MLSEDRGQFKLGKAELPEDATGALDNMVNQLKADKKAVWVEIEGHTDNTGDKMMNEKLGLARAEAVKRYLYEKHQIPLHKINVISYGEEKPVAPNNTKRRPRAEPPRRDQGPGVRQASRLAGQIRLTEGPQASNLRAAFCF